MNNLEKLAVDFSESLITDRPYAKEEVETILKETIDVIEKNKDKSYSELTNLIIEDTLVEFRKLIEKGYNVPLPGMIVGLNVNNSNIMIIDGKQDYNGRDLSKDSLFDIASMTKLYTAVITYKLLELGYFNLNSKVQDICPEFTNIDDITVDDLLKFNVSYKTNGRVDDSKTREEAKEKFYNLEIKGKNYEYNDFHTMILKEILEKVTGKNYEQLLEEYIVRPLELTNTHLTIPYSKQDLLTGTANKEILLPNDPKAVILGSGGHAGIFASNDDVISFSKSVFNESFLDSKYAKNLVVSSNCYDAKGNLVLNRGMFGSTYVNHELGLDKTFLDKTFFSNAYAYQGSTRAQGIGFNYQVGDNNFTGAATILQNPASTDFELVRKFEEETNAKRKSEGRDPIQVVKEYSFINDNSQQVNAKLIDGRTFVSVGSLDPINKAIATSLLKMSFLDYVSRNYEPTYQETVEQEIRIR